MYKVTLFLGCSLFKRRKIMENKQELTQEQYIIEKLGAENTKLRIALEQANFNLLLMQQELDSIKENEKKGKK
jgi:hypothetical protein